MYVRDLCVNGYREDLSRYPVFYGIGQLLHGDGVRKNKRGALKAVADGCRQPTQGSALPVRSSKAIISDQNGPPFQQRGCRGPLLAYDARDSTTI
jgi:hypothetical protein